MDLTPGSSSAIPPDKNFDVEFPDLIGSGFDSGYGSSSRLIRKNRRPINVVIPPTIGIKHTRSKSKTGKSKKNEGKEIANGGMMKMIEKKNVNSEKCYTEQEIVNGDLEILNSVADPMKIRDDNEESNTEQRSAMQETTNICKSNPKWVLYSPDPPGFGQQIFRVIKKRILSKN